MTTIHECMLKNWTSWLYMYVSVCRRFTLTQFLIGYFEVIQNWNLKPHACLSKNAPGRTFIYLPCFCRLDRLHSILVLHGCGNYEIVKLLVNANSDVNATPKVCYEHHYLLCYSAMIIILFLFCRWWVHKKHNFLHCKHKAISNKFLAKCLCYV